MAEQRFPKQKYVRQLHALRRELQEWANRYTIAWDETEELWLKERFWERRKVVNQLVDDVQVVIDRLYATPRLS